MKNANLTFLQVANRIMIGACTHFRYDKNKWWTVDPVTLRLRRRGDQTISSYMKYNPGCVNSPVYEVVF